MKTGGGRIQKKVENRRTYKTREEEDKEPEGTRKEEMQETEVNRKLGEVRNKEKSEPKRRKVCI